MFSRTVAAAWPKTRSLSAVEKAPQHPDMEAGSCFCLEDAKFSGLPVGLLFTDIWYTSASAAPLDWCRAALQRFTHARLTRRFSAEAYTPQPWGCGSVWKPAEVGNILEPGKVAVCLSTCRPSDTSASSTNVWTHVSVSCLGFQPGGIK